MPQHAPAAEDASDAELLERVRGGTPAALRPLYERHGAMVYHFALLWSGSSAIAADVTQDVFVHLLTHAADFDPVRGRLPPPYREALILVDLHECSYAEAAAQCGCAMGTIRSRLSRARALLVGLLAGGDPEEVSAAAVRR